VADHSYPLVQVITVFFDPHGTQAEAVREFLRYVLSEQGQQAVREDGGYTALTPAIAATGRRQLK
jgi:phosphate transport system substrate-binding protein